MTVCFVTSQTENWYQLSGITPIGEWGSLRLRLRYSHDLAMPCEEYSSLKELLMDGQLEVVRALAGLRHVDRVPLAAALLKVFRSAHTHCCSLAELADLGWKGLSFGRFGRFRTSPPRGSVRLTSFHRTGGGGGLGK